MSTTVVNIHFPRGSNAEDVDYVFIARPSKWGNPFKIGKDGTRADVISKYREWVLRQSHLIDALPELRGMRLGCYCYPNPCHGDVLAELADAAPSETNGGKR